MGRMTDDKFLTVRLSPDLYQELAELAERNERTIAAEVRLAIKDRLNDQQEAVAS